MRTPSGARDAWGGVRPPIARPGDPSKSPVEGRGLCQVRRAVWTHGEALVCEPLGLGCVLRGGSWLRHLLHRHSATWPCFCSFSGQTLPLASRAGLGGNEPPLCRVTLLTVPCSLSSVTPPFRAARVSEVPLPGLLEKTSHLGLIGCHLLFAGLPFPLGKLS